MYIAFTASVRRPLIAFLWAVPISGGALSAGRHVPSPRRELSSPIRIWHVAVLFQATLTSDLVHTVQHASFLFTALLLWWALIHSRRGVKAYGAAILYLFTTAMHNGALGALFTFGSRVWYPAYAKTTQSWGLEPLEDQQLGGLIMWIPMGVVYILAGMALFAGWLRESDRHTQDRLPD